MYKAISWALALLLTILVLRLALPQVAGLVVQIIMKILGLINRGLDLAATQTLQ